MWANPKSAMNSETRDSAGGGDNSRQFLAVERKYQLDRVPGKSQAQQSTEIYRNVSVDDCAVDNRITLSPNTRKAHSSPIRNPHQRRRYSQGAVLFDPSQSIFPGTSSVASPISGETSHLEDGKFLRHSSENLRDPNKLPSIRFIDQELQLSPGKRLRSSTRSHKRHNDKINCLDDIVESPLVKTPNVDDWFLSVSHTGSRENLYAQALDKNDAFGPKIQLDYLPGTPMEHHHSLDALTGDSSPGSTNFVVRNELNERRKSLDLVNRPPTPTHFNNFMSIKSSLDELTTQPNSNSSSINNVDNYHRKSIHNHVKNQLASQGEENTNGNHTFVPPFKSKSGGKGSNNNNNKKPGKEEHADPESLMFRDGRRKIDMVLCFEEESQGVMTELEARKREQRKAFQENLIKEGLEVELEDKALAFDEKTYFLKVHIPWRTETRYAEVMNLKLPVKRFITISVKAWDEEKEDNEKPKIWQKWWRKLMDLGDYDHNLIEKEPSFTSATSGGNPEEQFIVKDRCTTYTSAQRSTLVMEILLRARIDDTEKVGIRRLLNDGTYLACFPLHEGRYDRPNSTGAIMDRRLLYLEWARPFKFYKKQPLCLIRKYFGDKIALYFCWLGFYTKMLIFPSVVGFLCFLYGLASMDSEYNTPSKEICDYGGIGNTTLCPLCDKACSYQRLHESCIFAKMTYLFDNPSTVFFAIFMSFWATSFLELWKRKQSIITWEWDLQDFENENETRPEFETTAKNFRTNPVTREKEPYTPNWTKAMRYMITGSAVLFMICVVLSAVLGTIIYRLSLVTVIYSGGGSFLRRHAKIFTTMTAALINLVIIMILTRIYHKLALYLTNMENPRTQTEYEDSFTFKIFFFEFMNFYSSLIYIAFFKGRFFDYPGDDVVRKSEFYRLKGDICDPAGCLSELCIQLAIIMVGKQMWNNFMEYLFPKFYNWWRQRKHKKQTKDEAHLHMSWEQDYHLQDPGRLALFDEYLEMILQYGFVTLFVAAFPLAPLFALLNNIGEIRLDAFKMVTQARRPLAERVEDIGAWFGILKIITYAAVVSNAFVIAYTSDFIPRMVYKFVYSPGNNLVGYIEHSLSTFNTSDYKEEWGATPSETDPDTCRYRGYRKDSKDPDDPYGLNPNYWHVFAARLAFVVIFEHVVFVLTGIMQFIIPDVPTELKTQIQREQLLAKEAKYQHGLKKSRDAEYDDLLQTLRDQSESMGSSRTGLTGIRAGSWARRLSRMSDGIDAHVDVTSRTRRSIESTVWEVT